MKTFGFGTLFALSSLLFACSAAPVDGGPATDDVASADTVDAPRGVDLIEPTNCRGFVRNEAVDLVSHSEGNAAFHANWTLVSCSWNSVSKTGIAHYQSFVGSSAIQVDVNVSLSSRHTLGGVTACPLTAYTCARAADRLVMYLNDPAFAPLFELHSGCNDASLGRTAECTAAANRFCLRKGWGAGLVAKGSYDAAGTAEVSCFQPEIYRFATYAELRSEVPPCSDTQSLWCLSAIHRICENKEHTLGGLAQQIGADRAIIACANAGIARTITMAAVPGCTADNHAGVACTSAITDWCRSQGAAAGVAQEAGPGVVGAMCFTGTTFTTTFR